MILDLMHDHNFCYHATNSLKMVFFSAYSSLLAYADNIKKIP